MKIEQFYDYLEKLPYLESQLVRIRCRYSREDESTENYETNELLEYDFNNDVWIWYSDWHEGQEDVEILGCLGIHDINVPLFDKIKDKDAPTIIEADSEE